MTDPEIEYYIKARDNLLNMDEILHLLDKRDNPQIDHHELVDGRYRMWSTDGNYFEFMEKEWS